MADDARCSRQLGSRNGIQLVAYCVRHFGRGGAARGHLTCMHCGAGIGRAGTMAACVLLALGESTTDAVRTVATHRVFAGPGNASQWALVEGVAALLGDARC